MKATYKKFGILLQKEFKNLDAAQKFLEEEDCFPWGVYDDSSDTFYVSKSINEVIDQNAATITKDILDQLFEIGIEPKNIVFSV